MFIDLCKLNPFLHTPISDDENEVKNEAFRIAEIGNKIYQNAKERLLIKRQYEATKFIGECLVEVAEPSRDLDRQVIRVIQCTIYRVGAEEWLGNSKHKRE